MPRVKLNTGDLVEYWVPPGEVGHLDYMGTLGLVVDVDRWDSGAVYSVLWGPFESQGPQWMSASHLRPARRRRERKVQSE